MPKPSGFPFIRDMDSPDDYYSRRRAAGQAEPRSLLLREAAEKRLKRQGRPDLFRYAEEDNFRGERPEVPIESVVDKGLKAQYEKAASGMEAEEAAFQRRKKKRLLLGGGRPALSSREAADALATRQKK